MNLNISSQQFWSYLRQLAAATGGATIISGGMV